MGKIDEQSHAAEDRNSSGLVCARCSVVLDKLAKEFNFKCVFILILGLSILLSGLFWILPHRAKSFGYDAKEEIKIRGISPFHFFLSFSLWYFMILLVKGCLV